MGKVQDQYNKNRRRPHLQIVLLIAIIVLVNVLLSGVFFQLDLYGEKDLVSSDPQRIARKSERYFILPIVYLVGELLPI